MVKKYAKFIPAIVGAVFFTAGFLKAKDPSHLNNVLVFDGFPVLWLSPLALFVVQWEILLGLALMLGLARRKMAVVALFTLVVFSAQLCYLLTFLNPPDCGCLGGLNLYKSGRSSAQFGLARNALLVTALVYYLFLNSRESNTDLRTI